MALKPQTIGKEMPHGFAGSYARQPDMIVQTRPVGGTAGTTAAIPFGAALMYDSNGNAVLFGGTGTTAAKFVGVAGREIKSALTYMDQSTGAYAVGEACNVFQRGSINVKCQKGTAKMGGDVYARIAVTDATPSAIVGGFEAEADATTAGNVVKLTNCQWGGTADANGIAELVILTRQNA